MMENCLSIIIKEYKGGSKTNPMVTMCGDANTLGDAIMKVNENWSSCVSCTVVTRH